MHLSANPPFRLAADWLNAQAFRWTERRGWFYGIVEGALIKVRNAAGGDGIEFEGGVPASAVERYFRLDEDIAAIHDALRKADPKHMPGLIEKYGCIRVLRQDSWECLVAYICSARASVDDIRGKLNKLADCCGDTLTLDGVTCRSVPSAEQLKDVGVEKLRGLDLGLPRIPVTLNAVATDVAEGKLRLDDLSRKPLADAKKRLKNDYKGNGYPGIGDKIADCVCLFSLGHDEAFPVDRHIKAALARIGKDARGAHKAFGPNAGYAGQLLFLDQRSPLS